MNNTSNRPSAFFALAALAALFAVPAAACGGGGDNDDDTPDAAISDASVSDASVADAGSDSGIQEEDAGLSDAGLSDAGLDTDADVPEFHGCDLMEFAPEHRNNQFSESALLNMTVRQIGYFLEMTWFEGGEAGTWMLDAIRFSAPIDPTLLSVGSHKLSGNALGNNDDCVLCLDLGRDDMDNRIYSDFYPEDVRIDIQSADLTPGGALKFSISGIFREDGNPAKRSWCVNALEVNTVLEQMCQTADTCPEDKPVCDYPVNGSYTICMKDADADAGM